MCCTESHAVVLSLWRRDRNRMDSGENDDTRWYRTLTFFMTLQEVTPYCHGPFAPLVMRDTETATVFTRYESMLLRSLRKSERTIARDPVQDKRYSGQSIRNINKDERTDGVWYLPNFWKKVINKRCGELYWGYMNVVPLWIKPCQKCRTVAIILIQPLYLFSTN